MLSSILGSKSRARIITLFYLNDGKSYHIREVARLLKLNPTQARNELAKLAELGLFKKEIVGNVHSYRVDPLSPYHADFLSIVRKSAGFEAEISGGLRGLSGVRFAFIFGSYANRTFGPKSDIDLMIIGEPDMQMLNTTITKLERRIKRQIQYLVYPLAEFREKRSYGFVKNVMDQKKIFIIGDSDELE